MKTTEEEEEEEEEVEEEDDVDGCERIDVFSANVTFLVREPE
jgi:hypothetical protein